MKKIKYRTQEQFDEIVDSLINGNFDQAVDFVIAQAKVKAVKKSFDDVMNKPAA